ncbi:MAG: hypothetical protein Kow00128_22500 [Deltaproteobacteria bacterium]
MHVPRGNPFLVILLLPLAFSLLSGPFPDARAATPQPIAYSHRIHVTGYRIDCRFCHSSARKTKYAGIPPVSKCMICHRSIAVNSPEVKKLAKFWKEKKPIPWNRVIDFPDHTYFPHYRMVGAGISCLECHPGMDRAGTAVQKRTLSMGFCMGCHRSRGVSIDCWTCHY